MIPPFVGKTKGGNSIAITKAIYQGLCNISWVISVQHHCSAPW